MNPTLSFLSHHFAALWIAWLVLLAVLAVLLHRALGEPGR